MQYGRALATCYVAYPLLHCHAQSCMAFPSRTALFELGSKLTHTCGAANTKYDAFGGKGHHVALTHIAPGELLTTSYFNLLDKLMPTFLRYAPLNGLVAQWFRTVRPTLIGKPRLCCVKLSDAHVAVLGTPCLRRNMTQHRSRFTRFLCPHRYYGNLTACPQAAAAAPRLRVPLPL